MLTARERTPKGRPRGCADRRGRGPSAPAPQAPRAESTAGTRPRPGGRPRRDLSAHRLRRLRVLGVVLGLAIAGGASASKYTVRRGDTLAVIASRNHTTVDALATANNITNPDHIEVGQSLMLS